MMKLRSVIKAKKYFLILSSLIFLFAFTSLVFSQTTSKSVTICELLQNKKKYNGKRVVVENLLQIAAETSTFQFEDKCSISESVTVGSHDTFRPDSEFEKQTDLISLQTQAEKKLGVSQFSLRWGTMLRVKIKAEGIFKVSSRPKYGHLNSYKNAFLITNVEKIGNSELIFVQDSFKDNPKVIARNEND